MKTEFIASLFIATLASAAFALPQGPVDATTSHSISTQKVAEDGYKRTGGKIAENGFERIGGKLVAEDGYKRTGGKIAESGYQHVGGKLVAEDGYKLSLIHI